MSLKSLIVGVGLAASIAGCAATTKTAVESTVPQVKAPERAYIPKPLTIEECKEQALTYLREQGVTVDDTVRCGQIIYDGLDQFDLDQEKANAEYDALERAFSVKGERIVGWYQSNEQRRVLTVNDSVPGDKSKPSGKPATGNIYAYTQVTTWEAYVAGRKYFCIQASGPLDLTLTESGLELKAAQAKIKQMHEADLEKVTQADQSKRESIDRRLEERDKQSQEKLKQRREERYERLKLFQEDSNGKVETYHREMEHRHTEKYQQQGTSPEAPSQGGDEAKTPELKRGTPNPEFEKTKTEIDKRYEEEKAKIRKRYEEERKKVQKE